MNLARYVFLDHRSTGFFLDWDTIADDVVGTLRTTVGRNPTDRALSDLVGELTTRSDAFATRWARHNVRIHRTSHKRIHNSIVGDVELTGDALELPADELTVVAYTAAAGSHAHDQLRLLATWSATERAADPEGSRSSTEESDATPTAAPDPAAAPQRD